MAIAKLVKIKNVKLTNSTISTSFGKYNFNAEGTVQVPKELATLLVSTVEGFSFVDEPTEKANATSNVIKTEEKVEELKVKD